MGNACWQSKLVQPTAKWQIANGKQWLSTCPEWQMTDATWNSPFFSPTNAELTVIARHIHGHNLYEAITFHQFPQKQLRHVEDQHQVWIVRQYPLSHCTAEEKKKGGKRVREKENKWNEAKLEGKFRKLASEIYMNFMTFCWFSSVCKGVMYENLLCGPELIRFWSVRKINVNCKSKIWERKRASYAGK